MAHDVVGGTEGRLLQGEQSSPWQGASIRKTRVVELGTEIVVVEDEPRTVAAAQPPGDGPEDVRRVARLEHVELALATGTEHQRGSREEGVRVLQDEAERSAPWRVGTDTSAA